MRIRVDMAACTGHGRCYSLAPEVYEPDELGQCSLIMEIVPPELQDAARRGASNCPENAISLDEE